MGTMEENEVFNHLVHDLSDSERKSLLTRLEKIVIDIPVINDTVNGESDDSSPVRHHLGIIERIIMFIRSLLSEKNYQHIQEDYFLDRLSKKLDKSCPNLFSFENGDFYPEFGEEILRISKSASALQLSVLKAFKEKTGFIAFLTGLIMPELGNRLEKKTNPYLLETELENPDNIVIRRAIETGREKIFEELEKPDRDEIYKIMKGFYSLASFLSFQFESFARSFQNSIGIPNIAAIGDVKSQLETFHTRINSFNVLPQSIVLEAVYLYSHPEKSLSEGESLAREIKEFASEYNKLIECINHFNTLIPIDKLLKVANRNLDYSPAQIKFGGEEWFSIYRRFWEERNLSSYMRYQKEKKRLELISVASGYLNLDEYPYLTFYKRDLFGNKVHISNDFTASFIYNFVQFVFLVKMNPFLKLIQSDGDFYKEQNQTEFNNTYGSIFTLQRKIQEFDQAFSPDGEYGRRIREIRQMNGESKVVSHEIQNLILAGEKELKTILFDFTIKTDLLVNVLWGILFGEVGGRYDSLSNLGYIGGSSNDRVLMSLNNIYTEFKTFIDILHQIQDMEK